MAHASTGSVPATEDESNSFFSHDDGGSSGDDHMQQEDAPVMTRKKRKREIYQKTSCELCKARKVKCDKAEPACSWCAQHNRKCVYLERQKPGSRTGFALELESKVNRVDALLQTLWRRFEDHLANDHHASLSRILPSTVSSSLGCAQIDDFGRETSEQGPSGGGMRGPSITQPSAPVLPTESRYRVDEPGRVQRIPPPPATAVSGPALLPGTADIFTPSSPNDTRNGSTSRLGAHNLPPQDMIYTLVDLYFKHCNTWCPILDRKTTFTAFFGSTSMSEADRALLHAIIATTLRFLEDSRLSREMQSHHHAISKNTVMMYAMEHVSIEAQRALVILALDELGTSNGPRSRNLLSVLVQNVRQLNLGDENRLYLCANKGDDAPGIGLPHRVVVPKPASWIEDEGRRRLCWMVYLLDRYATISTTTSDFLLDDSRMKRFLPCSYDLFSRNVPVKTRWVTSTPGSTGATDYAVNNMSENLGSFSYHCEVLTIISKIHDFLKAPIDITSSTAMSGWRDTYRSLDGALDRWLESLPSEYGSISAMCHSDPASRVANWFMLHSAYVTAVVRLHSSAAYPALRSHIFVPSQFAMQRCLSAVQSLRDITQDVYEANGLNLVGPPFAFSLWVAARLLIVHAAAVGCSVDPKIDFFVDMLGYVGQYWDIANTYASILARIVRKQRQDAMTFERMRRSAHQLLRLASAARRSGLDEAASRPVSSDELDNVDVFEFFNYPKNTTSEPDPDIMQAVSHQSQGLVSLGSDQGRDAIGPEAPVDWLGY